MRSWAVYLRCTKCKAIKRQCSSYILSGIGSILYAWNGFGFYSCAKFGCGRCSSFDNYNYGFTVWCIWLENACSCPQNWGFDVWLKFPPLWHCGYEIVFKIDCFGYRKKPWRFENKKLSFKREQKSFLKSRFFHHFERTEQLGQWPIAWHTETALK